jgi:hypothetical protein
MKSGISTIIPGAGASRGLAGADVAQGRFAAAGKATRLSFPGAGVKVLTRPDQRIAVRLARAGAGGWVRAQGAGPHGFLAGLRVSADPDE